ncbi:MAG: SDR family NAD(P)-dependent oxidoreductase [Parvibaculaceae bacterium]
MKLAGKKALIVGASSGAGLETARLFAAEGAELALVGRSKDKLAAAATGLGGTAHAIAADVGDTASCAAIVPRAIETMGGLDILVYAAGLCEPCLVKDLTVERFKQHLDVNLTGNFIVARAAALHMNDGRGGAIVNFASELAHIGMGYYVHYCAAKAGVVGLTMALAAEMAPKVRVNAVSPGPIDTPMLAAEIEWFGGTQEVIDGAIGRVPLKRFASPEEVAKAVLFLIADAPYATGSALRLDGGTTIV